MDFDQSFKPVVPACYCFSRYETLDVVQVLGIALWRPNLKPVKFNKNLPVDFHALQPRPQSLVIADVTTLVLSELNPKIWPYLRGQAKAQHYLLAWDF